MTEAMQSFLPIPNLKPVIAGRAPLAALACLVAITVPAAAFPPAPYHTVHGVVRNEQGHPLGVDALVMMSVQNEVIYRGTVGASKTPGTNYTLRIPMDSGSLADLYRPSALSAGVHFTMTVTIGDQQYVPIEVRGELPQIGDPSQTTRLDLTLGLDSDADGLPDQWEQDLIDASADDDVSQLADVAPNDDFDQDGMSNLGEYIAGTYAFDRRDALDLKILEHANGHVHLRFLAITGRSYQVKASTNGGDYNATRFSVSQPDPSSSALYHVAEDVRYVDVFVPTADSKKQLFQLHVQ